MKKINEFTKNNATIREYLLSDEECTLTLEEADTLRKAYKIGGMEFLPRITVVEIPPKNPYLPNLYKVEFKCNQSDSAMIVFPLYAANIDELLKIYMEIANAEIHI